MFSIVILFSLIRMNLDVFQFKLDGQPLSSIEKDVMGTLALLSSLQLQYYDSPPSSFTNNEAVVATGAAAVTANGTGEINQTPNARSTRFLILHSYSSHFKIAEESPDKTNSKIHQSTSIIETNSIDEVHWFIDRIYFLGGSSNHSNRCINEKCFDGSRSGSNSSTKLTTSATRRKATRMREVLILEADVPNYLPSDVVTLLSIRTLKNFIISSDYISLKLLKLLTFSGQSTK